MARVYQHRDEWGAGLTPRQRRALRVRRGCARPGPLEQQLPLPRVARQRRRALELRARLIQASQLLEEVPPHARQQMVVLQRRLPLQRVDELETGLWTEGHRDGHRTIQLDDR